MDRLRRAFRMLFNRCILCGGKKEKHPICFHCIDPNICHTCMKRQHHAMNYGDKL